MGFNNNNIFNMMSSRIVKQRGEGEHMERKELEANIRKQIRNRRFQIFENIVFCVMILVMVWFLGSYIEVLHHNDVYWGQGIDIGYSKINMFEIMSKIWR